ncbi:MAG: tRNA 2-thiouridine(34) synthase MnmA [Clostridia bacterium]|nr:tRNA 2-thiouridine(34) synthase MnmA [Clostridia bacterium]
MQTKSTRVMIAMSGGVDSAVAALLLTNQGYDVAGMTMKLHGENESERQGGCCTAKDIEDATHVAARLGIPYEVCHFEADFAGCVIDRFVFAYEHGATPNPCVDCNRHLKFDKLYALAAQRGYAYLATGHYARIEEKDGRFYLLKAVDQTKDQSYMLYALTQEQLSRTIFPLGGLPKTEVRALADGAGFVNSQKPDSQDICFVPDGDYASFIEKYTKKNYPSGDFVDTEGKVLGKHQGIIRYTIGQRKGLGVAFGTPLYVCQICPEENRVVLGGNDDLFSTTFEAGELNWIAFDTPPATFRAKAKIRYRQCEQPATIAILPSGRAKVTFDEPQRAITRGQSVVFYQDDYVLGGGIIL